MSNMTRLVLQIPWFRVEKRGCRGQGKGDMMWIMPTKAWISGVSLDGYLADLLLLMQAEKRKHIALYHIYPSSNII